MRSKQAGLASFMVIAIVCSTLLSSAGGFSTTPNCVDPGGDQGPIPIWADILKVWVDNDDTYLRFKLELNGSFNHTEWPWFTAWISVDNSTGQDMGWDVPIDYGINAFGGLPYPPGNNLWTYGNGTNSLDDTIPKGMSYLTLTDNNHTLEFGYKMNTYYNDGGDDKGYLNISLGQTIYIRMQGEVDSDYAPDESLPMIRHVVKKSGDGIPSFSPLFLTFAMLAVFSIKLLNLKRKNS